MTGRVLRLSKAQVQHAAMAAMVMNHAAYLFFPKGSVPGFLLENIGYFTMPAMCWFLVQGFYATRSRKRYAGRMLLFAVLAQAPYAMYFGPPYRLDMLFTLLACMAVLAARSSGLDAGMRLFLQAALLAATSVCDWPYVAVIAVVLFDMSRKAGTRAAHACAFAVVAAASGLFMGLCAEPPTLGATACFLGGMCGPLAAGACILFLHDPGLPRGRTPRLYFYWFYPLHLAVLLFLKEVLIHA